MNKKLTFILILIVTQFLCSCSQSSYSEMVPIDDNLEDIARQINGAPLSFEQDHQ